MALHATFKIENIKASVEKYFKDAIETAESVTVDWEGLPFESGVTGITEWVQPRLIGFVGPGDWQPKASSSRRGDVASCILNTNIFVKKDQATATNRPYVLRDKVVRRMFADSGSSIPLRDYSGGTTKPWTCLIRVARISTDTMIPDPDYYGWNISFDLEWIREW